jgi:hypothetical protein
MKTGIQNEMETSELAYDDVAELYNTGDYLLEAERSLESALTARQRIQQLGDLRKCLPLLAHLWTKLQDPQARKWAAQLQNQARMCIARVQNLIAYDQLVKAMEMNRYPSTPAA